MASTRDRNTMGNHAVYLRANARAFDLAAALPCDQTQYQRLSFPGDGIQGPPRGPATHLMNNAVDVESFLRGIRVNDLTTGNGGPSIAAAPVLQPVEVPSIHLFRNERTTIMMPSELVIRDSQRPPLFSRD
jgi:hypothetical protein